MPTKPLPPHGDHRRYWRGCRCDECRIGLRVYDRARRAERKKQGCPEELHGTSLGYASWGCRCERCTNANRIARREYMIEYRKRTREHARAYQRYWYHNIYKPKMMADDRGIKE